MPAGTVTLANGNNGIWQNGSDDTTIGGTTALTRNIISGNDGDGISLGTGNNALVEGNYIGTDVTGTRPLGNRNRPGVHQRLVCHHRRDRQPGRAT